MLSKQEILSYLFAHKKHFMKDFYVDKIGLIGSYARDEQHENSDIDLVVYFNSAANDNLFNIYCDL